MATGGRTGYYSGAIKTTQGRKAAPAVAAKLTPPTKTVEQRRGYKVITDTTTGSQEYVPDLPVVKTTSPTAQYTASRDARLQAQFNAQRNRATMSARAAKELKTGQETKAGTPATAGSTLTSLKKQVEAGKTVNREDLVRAIQDVSPAQAQELAVRSGTGAGLKYGGGYSSYETYLYSRPDVPKEYKYARARAPKNLEAVTSKYKGPILSSNISVDTRQSIRPQPAYYSQGYAAPPKSYEVQKSIAEYKARSVAPRFEQGAISSLYRIARGDKIFSKETVDMLSTFDLKLANKLDTEIAKSSGPRRAVLQDVNIITYPFRGARFVYGAFAKKAGEYDKAFNEVTGRIEKVSPSGSQSTAFYTGIGIRGRPFSTAVEWTVPESLQGGIAAYAVGSLGYQAGKDLYKGVVKPSFKYLKKGATFVNKEMPLLSDSNIFSFRAKKGGRISKASLSKRQGIGGREFKGPTATKKGLQIERVGNEYTIKNVLTKGLPKKGGKVTLLQSDVSQFELQRNVPGRIGGVRYKQLYKVSEKGTIDVSPTLIREGTPNKKINAYKKRLAFPEQDINMNIRRQFNLDFGPKKKFVATEVRATRPEKYVPQETGLVPYNEAFQRYKKKQLLKLLELQKNPRSTFKELPPGRTIKMPEQGGVLSNEVSKPRKYAQFIAERDAQIRKSYSRGSFRRGQREKLFGSLEKQKQKLDELRMFKGREPVPTKYGLDMAKVVGDKKVKSIVPGKKSPYDIARQYGAESESVSRFPGLERLKKNKKMKYVLITDEASMTGPKVINAEYSSIYLPKYSQLQSTVQEGAQKTVIGQSLITGLRNVQEQREGLALFQGQALSQAQVQSQVQVQRQALRQESGLKQSTMTALAMKSVTTTTKPTDSGYKRRFTRQIRGEESRRRPQEDKIQKNLQGLFELPKPRPPEKTPPPVLLKLRRTQTEGQLLKKKARTNITIKLHKVKGLKIFKRGRL